MKPLRINPNVVEVFFFGLVGVGASLTHFAVAVVLVEVLNSSISMANIVGFLGALPVSYLGHAFLTFSARRYGRKADVTRQSAVRFFVLAAIGFALNHSSVVWFAEHQGYPHRTVLGCTIICVAGFLYLASKLWAFSGKRHSP